MSQALRPASAMPCLTAAGAAVTSCSCSLEIRDRFWLTRSNRLCSSTLLLFFSRVGPVRFGAGRTFLAATTCCLAAAVLQNLGMWGSTHAAAGWRYGMHALPFPVRNGNSEFESAPRVGAGRRRLRSPVSACTGITTCSNFEVVFANSAPCGNRALWEEMVK